MKVISRIAIVLVASFVLASAPASAFCSLPSLFLSYNVYTGSNGNPADVLGSFWGVGNFVAANGAGSDNGSVPGSAWTLFGFGGLYVSGDWAGLTGYDGCAQDPPNPSPNKMAFVISEPGTGGKAYFGGGCTTENALANFNFGSIDTAQTIPMQEIPKPVITNSVRAPGSVNITVAAPSAPGGIFDDATCGLGVKGYQLVAFSGPEDGPAPTTRVIAGTFSPLGTAGSGGASVNATINCTTATDTYIGWQLIMGDNVIVPAPGPNALISVPLQHTGALQGVRCNQTTADQPNDFKIIKKPARRGTTQNPQ